jgi:hypothetical protein
VLHAPEGMWCGAPRLEVQERAASPRRDRWRAPPPRREAGRALARRRGAGRAPNLQRVAVPARAPEEARVVAPTPKGQSVLHGPPARSPKGACKRCSAYRAPPVGGPPWSHHPVPRGGQGGCAGSDGAPTHRPRRASELPSTPKGDGPSAVKPAARRPRARATQTLAVAPRKEVVTSAGARRTSRTFQEGLSQRRSVAQPTP